MQFWNGTAYNVFQVGPVTDEDSDVYSNHSETESNGTIYLEDSDNVPFSESEDMQIVMSDTTHEKLEKGVKFDFPEEDDNVSRRETIRYIILSARIGYTYRNFANKYFGLGEQYILMGYFIYPIILNNKGSLSFLNRNLGLSLKKCKIYEKSIYIYNLPSND